MLRTFVCSCVCVHCACVLGNSKSQTTSRTASNVLNLFISRYEKAKTDNMKIYVKLLFANIHISQEFSIFYSANEVRSSKI